ncbi:MAG TPA: hypothetical protein VHS96_09175 [Bacteroidia bacterium]|nr:hypothetical protein [Bacteroidia bacterium]
MSTLDTCPPTTVPRMPCQCIRARAGAMDFPLRLAFLGWDGLSPSPKRDRAAAA